MLRHVTVISSDGITIYHKSYVKSDLDDVLFSALTGAIIAFTKELGDELFSIMMKKQAIFFKSLGDNIVIFSLDTVPNINQRELDNKLQQAVESETLQVISNMGVTQNVNRQLDLELAEIFNIDPDDLDGDQIDPISIEDLTGEAFLEALNKLDTI